MKLCEHQEAKPNDQQPEWQPSGATRPTCANCGLKPLQASPGARVCCHCIVASSFSFQTEWPYCALTSGLPREIFSKTKQRVATTDPYGPVRLKEWGPRAWKIRKVREDSVRPLTEVVPRYNIAIPVRRFDARLDLEEPAPLQETHYQQSPLNYGLLL